MRKFLSYILPLALVSIIFCAANADRKSIEAYYPLKEGMKWIYKQEIFKNGELLIENKITYTNLAEREFHGRKVVPRKQSGMKGLISQSDKIIFVGKDEGGFFNIGTQNLNPDQSVAKEKIFSPPLYFIKTPLIANKTWSQEEKGLVAEYTIERLDEEVTAFSRTFEDCIRLKVKVFEDSELVRELTSWYAPEVGLVKFHSVLLKSDMQFILTLELFGK